MSFLENLAMGLRQAGRVYSPAVSEEVSRMENNDLARENARFQMIAQQVIKGVENGSIAPAQGKAALEKIGMGGIEIGPSPEVQANQDKLKNRLEFRKVLQGLDTNSPSYFMDVSKAAMQFGDEATAVRFVEAHLKKIADAENKAATLQQRLYEFNEQMQFRRDTTATAEQQEARNIRDNQTRRDIVNELNATREFIASANRSNNDRPHAVTGVDANGNTVIMWPRPSQGTQTLPIRPLSSSERLPVGYRRSSDGSMERIPLTGGNPWTDDAIKADALYSIVNGKPPQGSLPLGRDEGNRYRDALRNARVEVANELGIPADEMATLPVVAKTKLNALSFVQRDLAAIRPYDEMLNTNAAVAIQLAKKIASERSDIPLLNKPITWLQQNAQNNPNVAEYLAQMNFVRTEAARVLNNPRLVGQLTDSARKEMENVINGNMTIDSTERVINRIVSDGKNRVNAIEKEVNTLQSEIKRFAQPRSGGGITPPPPPGFTEKK